MRLHVLTQAGGMHPTAVYIVPDARGETDTYEAWSLEGRDLDTGKLQWVEGIRKDRSNMLEPLRSAVDQVLALLKE